MSDNRENTKEIERAAMGVEEGGGGGAVAAGRGRDCGGGCHGGCG